MSDRQWRRNLTRISRQPTPVEAPRQVVYDDDARLDQFDATASGVVPPSGGGSTTFLRADGVWATPPGGAGGELPVGSIYLSAVATDPSTLLGYGTWSSIGAGRVLVGVDTGDTDFDTPLETGGAKTVAAAGTVAAPTMSGSTASESSHTHTVSTNVTVNSHASHTHTYTEVPNHVHGVSTLLRTATTGGATTHVAQTVDTSSTADATRKTDNPDGGVATGTTAGPNAALEHTVINNDTTSGAGASHSHGAGTLAASAPSFTGSATSVVQPYLTCYIWQRTA